MGCRGVKKAIYTSKIYKFICYLLEWISLGQYSSILYLKKKNEKSSSIGGFVTLVWYLIVLYYAVGQFLSVFRMEKWNLAQNTYTLSYYLFKPG